MVSARLALTVYVEVKIKITLTFDNGPDPNVTPLVLKTLEQEEVQAIFFVLGSKLKDSNCLDLARSARQAGHVLGNHSFWHQTPFGELDPPVRAVAEIDLTQALLSDLAADPPLFRPSGKGGLIGRHLLNQLAADHLRQRGYTMALWNCVPRDWLDPDGWASNAIKDCGRREWSVVVLHDLPTGAMAHLPEFIRRLRDNDAEFSTDFPPSCTPIVAGRAVEDLTRLMPRRVTG